MDSAKLTKSHAVYRGQVTKLQNKYNNIFAQAEHTEDDQDSLVATLESIREKLEIITNLGRQIQELASDDDLEQLLVESDDYVTSVREYLVKSERKRNRKFTPGATNTSVAPNASNAVADSAAQRSDIRKRNVMLPKLSLRKFDGDILKWPEFHDSFVSAIDSNTELSNVEKFQYLRGQLDGDAACTIEGLSLTQDNYANAMSILRERYGQPHKVIDALFNTLWNLPTPDYTLDSLKVFYNQLETCIRGLSSMGKPVDNYGDVLISLLRRKLPQVIRTQFARDIGNRTWKLDDFRSSLLKEIETIQASDIDGQMDHNDKLVSTAAFHMRTSKFPSKQGSRTNQSNDSRFRSKACVFCKGSHSPCDCTVIVDKKKRHDVIVRDRLCFNCFGKHRAADCQSKFKCRICSRKHHTSLCVNSKPAHATGADKSSEHLSAREDTKVSMANLNGPVLLKTAIADISSGPNSITVHVLLDGGAQRSFITQNTVDALNLKCHKTENIQLSVFGEKTGTRSLDVAKFTLHTTSKFDNLTIDALVVPNISTPLRNYISKSVIDLPHLRNLNLAHPYTKCNHDVISILIGADYYWSIVGDRVVRGQGPTAISSKLGYLLSGPTYSKGSPKDAGVYHVNVDLKSHELEEFDLQRFWDLQTIGIRDEEIGQTHDYTSYSQTHIRKDGDRYIAKLPWKENHDALPTNYDVAVKRTRNMVRRLPLDTRETYHKIIRDQVSMDYIEPVHAEDTNDGHYLPHRAVIKESSSTPLRIVYDCSCAQNNNPSLNDCLQIGPSLLNDLTGILLRFRAHPVALSADIRKAFLQIGLDNDDRKYTKFMWLSNPCDTESDLNTYQFKSIIFGAVCSPFILNSTIRHHLEKENSAITSDLSQNIYVDNVISGCINTYDAVQYYNQANNVMTTGGFQLHSWSSNDPELCHYIELDGSLNPCSQVNVLGVQWDTKTDQLTYRNNASHDANLDILTKRAVVQQLASVYDPLGFIAPVLTRAKLYVQELWKEHYDWDQSLSDQLRQQWHHIHSDISAATTTIYDRKYFTHNITSDTILELHAFSDASQSAYGGVVYLLDVTNKQTALVMSKLRVAPVKQLTIPRLELLGVLIATKLLQFVFNTLCKQFNFTKKAIWTDS